MRTVHALRSGRRGVDDEYDALTADLVNAGNRNNWSTQTGIARAGNVNATGTGWLNFGQANCNVSAKLYCVGDRPV